MGIKGMKCDNEEKKDGCAALDCDFNAVSYGVVEWYGIIFGCIVQCLRSN